MVNCLYLDLGNILIMKLISEKVSRRAALKLLGSGLALMSTPALAAGSSLKQRPEEVRLILERDTLELTIIHKKFKAAIYVTEELLADEAAFNDILNWAIESMLSDLAAPYCRWGFFIVRRIS